MTKGNFRGRIKRFWIFLVLITVVAFVSNISVQMVLSPQVDYEGAIINSFTLALVLTIIFTTEIWKGKKKSDEC